MGGQAGCLSRVLASPGGEPLVLGAGGARGQLAADGWGLGSSERLSTGKAFARKSPFYLPSPSAIN